MRVGHSGWLVMCSPSNQSDQLWSSTPLDADVVTAASPLESHGPVANGTHSPSCLESFRAQHIWVAWVERQHVSRRPLPTASPPLHLHLLSHRTPSRSCGAPQTSCGVVVLPGR